MWRAFRFPQGEAISREFGLRGLFRLRCGARGDDPERAPFFQPTGAFVAQQGTADLAGIVAKADAHSLKTFRMLVAAELIGEGPPHAVSNGLRVRISST